MTKSGNTSWLISFALLVGLLGNSEPARAYSVLHSFAGGANDGSRPLASLITDGSGNLYGTNEAGGSAGLGTVYKVQTDGTGFQLLHSFTGGPNDGRRPLACLVADGSGNLYGTTDLGGPSDLGTVYKVKTDGTGFQLLHSFAGGLNDGSRPQASLITDGTGNLYGTTLEGGSLGYGQGTIFTIKTDGTGFQVLHSFLGRPDDGSQPRASLTLDGAGNLYGTSSGPEWYDFLLGTVFTMKTDGTGFRILHKFDSLSGPDGNYPLTPVILDDSGSLYGTTAAGPPHLYPWDRGVVFKMKTDGTAFQLLHTFLYGEGESEGLDPAGSLVLDSSGNLYGTTSSGGPSNYGTVFTLKTDGSSYQLLYSCKGSPGDGRQPHASLVLDGSGNLYGTTEFGGASDLGTIFTLPACNQVAPTPVAPAPGETGYTAGILVWSHPDGASQFDVYFDTVNPPEKRIRPTSSNAAAIPVYFPEQIYFWKVVAPGICGSSSTFSFTTGACPWTGSVPHLLAPANGSQETGIQTTLTWQPVPGAAHYAVYLGTTNPPSTVYRDVSAPATALPLRVNPATAYYWRVVAYPACGSSPPVTSPAFSFTTAPNSIFLTSISPSFANRWEGGSFQITGGGLSGMEFFTDRAGQSAGTLSVSVPGNTAVTVAIAASPSAPTGRYDVGVLDSGLGRARLNGVLALRAFTDVTESDYFFESSARIVDAGIMEPDSDPDTPGPQFGPGAGVSRAKMAEYLAKSYQWWRTGTAAIPEATCVPSGAGSTDFPDVPCSHPQWLAIHWIKVWGVTRGVDCPQGLCFLPDNALTRGEMVTFLERLRQGTLLATLLSTAGETDPGCAAPYPACSGWTDPEMKTPEWPRREVNIGFADRVTTGCSGSPGNKLTMCVQTPVTRDQMTEFLSRTIGLVPNP